MHEKKQIVDCEGKSKNKQKQKELAINSFSRDLKRVWRFKQYTEKERSRKEIKKSKRKGEKNVGKYLLMNQDVHNTTVIRAERDNHNQ